MASADTELLRARIRLELDKMGVSDAKAGLGVIYQSLTNSRKAADMMVDAIDSINEATQFAADTAESFLQPWKDASAMFVQTMGFADQTSAHWIKTQQRIMQSQLALGRAATRALQPWQDRLASILNMVTDFVEKNPELVQSAINIGAVVAASATAVNAATRVAATVRQTFSYIQQLRQLQGIGAGFGAAGILAVGLPAAGIAGMAGGKAISGGLASIGAVSQQYNAQVQAQTAGSVIKSFLQVLASAGLLIKQSMNNFAVDLAKLGATISKVIADIQESLGIISPEAAQQQRDAADKAVTDIANYLNKQLQEQAKFNDQAISKVGEFVDSALGQLNAGGAGAGPAAGFSQDVLDNFAQFMQQLQQQEQQFLAEQQRAITAFNRQMAEAEADFRESQAQAESEYQRSVSEAQKSYQEEQAQSRKDFYRGEQKATQDFLLAQERARQDHEYRLQDAAARLDALAVIQEQRQFAIDNTRAKEDFDRQRQQSQAEYRLQEKQRADNFKKQMAQMADQFRRQQTAAEQQFRKQQERERQHFQQQLIDQAASYNAQRQMAIDQYKAQMNLQMQYQTWSEGAIASYYSRLQAQLQAFIAGSSVPTTINWDGGMGGGGGGGNNSGPGGLGPGDSGYDPRKDPELRREWRMEVQDGSFAGTFEEWLRKNGFTWPGMAGGGYTGKGGLRQTHPHEFMLTASTTSALEQRMGGRLTQGSIASLGRGGGGGGMSITNVFNDVGQHSIGDLEAMVERVMTKLVRSYVGSAG